MSKVSYPVLGLAVAALLGGCAHSDKHPVHAAAHHLKVGEVKTIEFSGSGQWFQFGQAPNPSLAWPPYQLSSYQADIDYSAPSARVQIVRKQIVEPGRQRPTPVEQRVEQFVNGSSAWNVAVPNNSPPGTQPVASLQPAAVEERSAEIWATPQGFFKAAAEHQGNAETRDGQTELSFTVGGKYRYVGTINGKNELERIQTWIDNPVLGDTLVETRFSDYKDFGGVQFPGHIQRSQGGHPVLDLKVDSVKLNPTVAVSLPQELANAKPQPVTVTSTKLAEGVYYLTGGTHHSVAIEQKDHLVLVEAPLHEERSQALIAKLKESFPGKPIKYVVNTHAHFDHAGGLRSFVDEGAAIVTEADNEAYFSKVWANPHTINPDRLALSKKAPQFESYTGKHVLSDGSRSIEIYSLAGNSHNDAFDLIYLPKEKILIEADAFTPTAANAPPPATPNPYTVNLYDNIRKLHLDVKQIAALHGPRVTTLSDLGAAIGVAVKAEGAEPRGKGGKSRAGKSKAAG